MIIFAAPKIVGKQLKHLLSINYQTNAWINWKKNRNDFRFRG